MNLLMQHMSKRVVEADVAVGIASAAVAINIAISVFTPFLS